MLGYAGLYGTGGAVVRLVPAPGAAADQEFDEDDVEVFGGDRNVLDRSADAPPAPAAPVHAAAQAPPPDAVATDTAPDPVGPYPHARRVGDLLYLSGMGPPAAWYRRHPRWSGAGR